MSNQEHVIGFEALYASMNKCKQNVMWKDSAAHFVLNGAEEVLKLEQALKADSYTPRAPKTFTIKYPKEREILSISFKDRVYQRSLNDNVLYPVMTKSFIYDNGACQKGKGSDFSRGRLHCFMQRHFRKHGINGWVLQLDIRKYYPSMRHDKTKEMFRQKLSPEDYRRTQKILDCQYSGDVGFNPGSQMIQIAGISMLNGLDHMIKEKLRIKHYLRYMDDFILIHHDKAYLEYCESEILGYLAQLGFSVHNEKDTLYPLSKGIPYLGFRFHLTQTGKVVKSISRKNVKHAKQNMIRLANRHKEGIIDENKLWECYQSWRAHLCKGTSNWLVREMDKLFICLTEGDQHG